jgi:hypothetical protein
MGFAEALGKTPNLGVAIGEQCVGFGLHVPDTSGLNARS